MYKIFLKTISSFVVVYMSICLIAAIIKDNGVTIGDFLVIIIAILLALFTYHRVDEIEE